MHKILFSAFLLILQHTHAQTTVNGSFVHGGITRTYSFYVPAAYTPGQAVPLVLNLHGLGTDGAYQADNRDLRPVADTANFIVVHPDGSVEPSISQRFWNYGDVAGSTVDDVGFLESLIDTISAHYSINPDRVYSVGMSNGGFMSYYLACQSDRFAAVGSVTGSMSNDMYSACNPARATPIIHIHGTSDPINTYNGTSTSVSVDDLTRFWVNQNGCDTTPVMTAVPDIDITDDVTAERYVYSGGINGHTVEHFKVIDGGHTWPGMDIFTFLGNTCMDFSASSEVWRFFSQYTRNITGVNEMQQDGSFALWPNPAQGQLYIDAGNHVVNHISFTDMQGRVVLEQKATGIQAVDVSMLAPGHYIARVSGSNFYAVKKLVISGRD